ncbi:MAG TPA: hypothetical protein VG936_10930 [Lacunisphaera sp.]|nr:hypothetical protein [Lacunisphaera sp.]
MRNSGQNLPIYAWPAGAQTRYAVLIIVMETTTDQVRIVFEHFRGQDGALNYDRLVAYSLKKVTRAKFIDPSVSAQHAADYVNEAIQRCLPGPDGHIARSLEGDLPIEVMLKGIIESLISHDLYPSGIRIRMRGEFGSVENDNGARQLTADDYDEALWNDSQGDADIRETAGRKIDDKPVINEFMQFVQRDQVVHRMLRLLIEEDIDGPAELVASRVGISVPEVYQARKRLERLCRQFGQGRTRE